MSKFTDHFKERIDELMENRRLYTEELNVLQVLLENNQISMEEYMYQSGYIFSKYIGIVT